MLCQRCQCKVNGTKDVIPFHQHWCSNFLAYLRLQLLHRALCFGTILPNIVAVERIENYLRKSCPALLTKNVAKIGLSAQ
jgi:hypothetical protein